MGGTLQKPLSRRPEAPSRRLRASGLDFVASGSRRRAQEVLAAVEAELERRAVRAAEEVPGGSPNARAAADAVLRLARLGGVSNWISAQAAGRLADLESELEALLREKDPTKGPRAADDCLDAADLAIRSAFELLGGEVRAHAQEVADELTRQAEDSLSRHHGARTRGARGPDAGRATVLGATLEEHFAKMGSDAAFRFRAAVRAALAAGEDLDGVIARVSGGDPVRAAEGDPAPGDAPLPGEGRAERALADAAKKRLLARVRLMDAAENSVDKVIRAAMTELAKGAEVAAADDAEGFEEQGWQWVAVLDAGTCEQCEFLDGNRWTADREPVGDAPEFPDDPPIHFGCRCALVPSDLSAPPAPPKDLDDYLAGFSRAEQEEAFGKEALRAYRRGDLTAGQLIGDRENLITLERFRRGGGSVGASEAVTAGDTVGHPFHGNQFTGGMGGQLVAMQKWQEARAQSLAAKNDPASKAAAERKIREMNRLAEWKKRKAAELAAKPTAERERIAAERKKAAADRRAKRDQDKQEDAQRMAKVAAEREQQAREAREREAQAQQQQRRDALRRQQGQAPAARPAEPKPIGGDFKPVPLKGEYDERERRVRSALEKPDSVAIKNLGGGINGSNKAEIRTADGDTVHGVWKPEADEAPGIRFNMSNKDVSWAKREVAAHDVGRAMGLDIPVAKMATLAGKQGSFMEWGEGEVGRNVPAFQEKRATELAMFDVAIGNTDRHPGNYLVEPVSGRITPIDNGLSFPDRGGVTRVIGGNFSRFVASAARHQTTTSVEAARTMAARLSDPATRERIDETLRTAGIKQAGIDCANRRIDYMVGKVKEARTPKQMRQAFTRIFAHSWPDRMDRL